MPRTIQADGRTITVPDDATPDEINQIVGPPPAASSAPGFFKSIQNSFDTNTATSPTEPLLQTGLKRVVGTLGAPLIHPLDTLTGLANMIPSNPDVSTPTNQPDNPIVQRGQEAVSDYQQGGLPYAG